MKSKAGLAQVAEGLNCAKLKVSKESIYGHHERT
jgi:hypothetical protein